MRVLAHPLALTVAAPSRRAAEADPTESSRADGLQWDASTPVMASDGIYLHYVMRELQ